MTYKTPLNKRISSSERFKRRYRTDETFRLAHINRRRLETGLEPVSEMLPVGQVRPAWASARQRDSKGRFV